MNRSLGFFNVAVLLIASQSYAGRVALRAPQQQAANFVEACYLFRYPDVLKNWVHRGLSAVSHYQRYGKAEGRIPGCDFAPLAATPSAPNLIRQNFPASITIKSALNEGSAIELTSYPVSMGGAFGSLKWKGMEFINIHDRGRQLQSASHFDGHGECYNPTEAGAALDKADNGRGTDKIPSSSKPFDIRFGAAEITTRIAPAFWLSGRRVGGGCAQGAQVAGPATGHLFSKHVVMNYKGLPNAISYEVEYKNPAGVPKNLGVYEALTGYLITDFTQVFTLSSQNGSLKSETTFTPISGPGFPGDSGVLKREQKEEPMIIATGNGSHAMGIMFPQQQVLGRFDGYHFWKFGGPGGPRGAASTKWNIAVFDQTPGEQPQRNFRIVLVVGSLKKVQESLYQLVKEEGLVKAN